ncbi:MAG: FRG domain-containing protein [Dehalococcoidia bacterium]|nr:FRG domain-containing protein [Dehalococcoidia bacterium]
MAVEARFVGTDGWAFRGQDTALFPDTSLERHCQSLDLTGAAIVDLEVKLIRDFARHYHHYHRATPPPKGYTLEWLSILRHYGTPTRLLDLTYSFFIAAFFALETAEDSAVIWAMNVSGISREAKGLIAMTLPNGEELVRDFDTKRDEGHFRSLFMAQFPLRFVHSANPMRLNERLTIQQGIFVAPGDVTASFEENLRAVPNHANLIKQIVINPVCRPEVLRKLYSMGINSATLYPGLEGFARSLRTKSLILKDLPPQGVEALEDI